MVRIEEEKEVLAPPSLVNKSAGVVVKFRCNSETGKISCTLTSPPVTVNYRIINFETEVREAKLLWIDKRCTNAFAARNNVTLIESPQVHTKSTACPSPRNCLSHLDQAIQKNPFSESLPPRRDPWDIPPRDLIIMNAVFSVLSRSTFFFGTGRVSHTESSRPLPAPCRPRERERGA